MNLNISEEEYDLQLKDALKLRDSGDLLASLNILSRLLGYEQKRDAGILTIMGDLYENTNDIPQAINCFRKAIELAPTAELPSLALFHALWDSGHYNEGFAELRRFLSIAQSEEHFRLIEEMRDAVLEDQEIKKKNH